MSIANMYYLTLEAEQNIEEIPVESPNISLNNIDISSNQILVPLENKQHDPTDIETAVVVDDCLLSYINSQTFYPTNRNDHSPMNIEYPITRPISNTVEIVSINASEHIADKYNAGNKSFKQVESSFNKKSTKVPKFVHLLDRVVPPRAIAVLPAALHMRRDCILPRRTLPQRVRFGPVEGVQSTMTFTSAHDLIMEAAATDTPIFLLNHNHGCIHIDVSDKDKSNWFSLLPLGNSNTANVWLYEENNKLYGITLKSLPVGTPMALGYSKQYMQDHGIPQGQPVLDISQEITIAEEPRRFRCRECKRVLASASLLQRHVSLCHRGETTIFRRRNRCPHCYRTFSRLYALKRHIAGYCNMKSEEVDDSNKKTSDNSSNISINLDENRLPSDESLQNFTNGLDFSTSLFDTDRMPSLDISGSSRSDTEFPFSLTYDNSAAADLGFDKFRKQELESHKGVSENKVPPKASNDTLLITCPYCEETILKDNKRQHLSACPKKKLICECGLKFSNKKKFMQHISYKHSTSNAAQQESTSLEYKCEKCEFIFKRRGMLVNHLWRVHGASTRAPIQRRERLYPCGVCPKLYRAAAKRDMHLALHHPEISKGARAFVGCIEGTQRSVAAAACMACPRQYATRAKLLQHLRQRHPHLAPPLKKSSKAKKTYSGS